MSAPARQARPWRRLAGRRLAGRWLAGRWLAGRRAATAVLFALTILPVLGFVALAFDVGSVVWARAQLDLAADAAGLTAAAVGSNDFAANPQTSFQAAQLAGTKRFHAQASRMPGVTLTALDVAVSRNGGTIAATVSFTARYQTQFATLLGFPTLQTSGTATASRTNRPFIDFEFLLDDSGSMAIGASQADMDRLGALVRASPLFRAWGQNQNCAFGCHFDAHNNDFYGLAIANGVQLRLNVLTQAVGNVIQTLVASPDAAQFQVGVHVFNSSLGALYPTSSDLPDAALAVQGMAPPFGTDPENQTNIPLALQGLAAALPAAGDGSSAASPRRYLFFVSDAVADYSGPGGWRQLKAFDPADCSGLKSKNIQILTLYTEYVPIEPPYVPQANAFYQSNVKPFAGQLFPNMQACASSAAFAFQATDGPSINAALQTMLASALSAPARFTQ